jgi:creatine kinase
VIYPLFSGIYAGDEDSYKVFADVFDPLIMEYHGLPAGFKHTSDMDHSKLVGNIDAAAPVHRYVFK